MSDGNQMAFSLIYKIVDGASAKIREITAAMGEPKKAVEDLGDASEKSSDRQVSAWARAKEALDDMTHGMAEPAKRAVELGRVAGEAAERFSQSFAGIGAIAAEGFSAKDVIDQEEFFRRLRVNSALAKTAIEELGEKIADASQKYGVNKANLLSALEAYRDQGGNPEDFGRNAGSVGAAIALGMNADAAGVQLASLARLGITDPKQVLSVLSQMNAQLGGIPDRINAAAEASDRLVASMQSLHMSGAQGALALNAVYGVAARSMGGNARAARTATDNWLQQLADRGYQNQLSQGLGERITDANGFVMDPRIIMQKMAARYAQAMSLPQDQQAVALQRLDSLFGDDASRMFRAVGGQIKTSGHSDILEQALGAQGDPTAYLKRAQDASDGLTGGMNRLRAAMEKASEVVFTGPINLLAEALNHCNGYIADGVVLVASFITVGQGIKWIAGAFQGFALIWGFLGTVMSVVGGFLATFVVGLANVATAMVPVIAETIAWGVAMLANPVTWIVLGIIAAVALLGIGIYELYKHWDAAWGKMPAPVKFIGGVIESMWTGAKKLAGEFFDWATEKWDWLVKKFHAGWAWLSSLWGGDDEPAGGGEEGSGGGNSGTGGAGSGGPAPGQIGSTGSPGSHNLGNLRNVGGRGFQRFATDNDGALAMAHQLQRYQNRDHLNTIAQIISKYAPSSENNTGAYIAYVAKAMGIGAGSALNLADAHQLASLMHAMIHIEQGHDVLSQQQIEAVIAGGGTPRPGAGNDNSGAPGLMGGVADGPTLTGPSSIYGSATGPVPPVPASIFGNGATPGASAAPIAPASVESGTSVARAELTVRIEDGRKVKTSLEHSDDMEASLDRGGQMRASWG